VDLYRLVYWSRAHLSAAADMDAALAAILEVSRTRNEAASVTGALLACGPWFLQALEGHRTAVLQTYARIARDRRHDSPAVIVGEGVALRSFSGWHMCGLRLSPTDTQIVETLESSGAYDPAKLTPAGATKLLLTVRQIQSKAR
jgi:hypothetical protein